MRGAKRNTSQPGKVKSQTFHHLGNEGVVQGGVRRVVVRLDEPVTSPAQGVEQVVPLASGTIPLWRQM